MSDHPAHTLRPLDGARADQCLAAHRRGDQHTVQAALAEAEDEGSTTELTLALVSNIVATLDAAGPHDWRQRVQQEIYNLALIECDTDAE